MSFLGLGSLVLGFDKFSQVETYMIRIYIYIFFFFLGGGGGGITSPPTLYRSYHDG